MKVNWSRDPGDASELGVCEIHFVYEFKDSRVIMFVMIFFPWGGRIYCWQLLE